ncbi:hypothetical protein IFM12275_15090 [Nocardia sputorum]|nr:hypothetical protein IFM12275_15090 [Nocardia sputorum]
MVCLGCCLAPVLLAAGVLGGGITSVSLSWLQPLGFVLLAIGAAGLIWSGSRGKKCTGGTDPASACVGSGCGCAAATS